jgi:hypothetical protein
VANAQGGADTVRWERVTKEHWFERVCTKRAKCVHCTRIV